MRPRLFFALLCVVVLAESVFTAGLMPIVRRHFASSVSLAYGSMFVGFVAGQAVVALSKTVRRTSLAYPAAVVGLGAAVAALGWTLDHAPSLFPVVRIADGFAGGLALPLLLGRTLALPLRMKPAQRLAIVNSMMALGYVAGPLAIEAGAARVSETALLETVGALVVALGLLVAVWDPGAPSPPATERRPEREPGWRIARRSYGLFFAKLCYGYFIVLMASPALERLGAPRVELLMPCLVALFVVGQAVVLPLRRTVPRSHLGAMLPVVVAGLLAAGLRGGRLTLVAAAVVFHSCMVNSAQEDAADTAEPSHGLALASVLGDLGLVLGAFVLDLGPAGLLVLLVLSVVPWLLSLREPVRAEEVLPWVGIVTALRTFRKHKAPIREPVDDGPAPPRLRWTFTGAADDGSPVLRLAFAGDFAAVAAPARLALDVRAMLLDHDLRFLNLEGALVERPSRRANELSFYGISPEALGTLLGDGPPAFNAVAYVNNHALDHGAAAFRRTGALLGEIDGVAGFASRLRTLRVGDLRIGVAALTFGMNCFWRRAPDAVCIKPSEIVRRTPRAEALLAQIREWRGAVDLLVLSYHWGYESEFWPSQVQDEAWALLREAGVDVLYGHHSHIAQPIAIDDEATKVCLYSCGNLALEMPHPVYAQGVIHSVSLTRRDGGWSVVAVEPHFVEHAAGEIRFIAQERALVRASWAACTSRRAGDAPPATPALLAADR